MDYQKIDENRTKIDKVYAVGGSIWTTPNGPDDGGICLLKADRNEDKTSPHERDCNIHFAALAINYYLKRYKILNLLEDQE